jgi:hypothetical protein
MPLIGKVAGVATLHAQNPRMAAADDAWSSAADDIFAQVSMVGTEQGHPAADFTVTASAIVLPAGGKWPLGNLIRDIAVSGRVDGPFPPFRTAAAWVRDWRDGGGSLVVKEAMIAWGPLAMNATATIALDDQLQPMGSGSAKVSGFMEALDRLSAAGVLTRSAATVAKAMLSLLAGTAVGDAPAEVEVPLSLQYRTLSMRQVPLLRLSELDWPGL